MRRLRAAVARKHRLCVSARGWTVGAIELRKAREVGSVGDLAGALICRLQLVQARAGRTESARQVRARTWRRPSSTGSIGSALAHAATSNANSQRMCLLPCENARERSVAALFQAAAPLAYIASISASGEASFASTARVCSPARGEGPFGAVVCAGKSNWAGGRVHRAAIVLRCLHDAAGGDGLWIGYGFRRCKHRRPDHFFGVESGWRCRRTRARRMLHRAAALAPRHSRGARGRLQNADR